MFGPPAASAHAGGIVLESYTGDLKPVVRGLGCLVLTTSKGVKSDKEARSENVGGEVLVRVY